MRRLVVTADDVGLHRGMNLGAVAAHHHGIVTACSVAATGREIDHACEALADCPNLDIGVHLVLVGEKPIRPAARIPSLVTGAGTLAADHLGFVARHALGRVSLAEVEDECRAQIEALLDRGLRLSHVNSHQHLHALPRVFDVVARLAREYGIAYVRVPLDVGSREVSPRRRLSIAALGHLARRARAAAERHGLLANDAALGVGQAGHLDAPTLRRLLRHCAAEVTELVTHPGIDGALIAKSYAWGYVWDAETAGLCDPGVRALVEEAGIVLTRPSRLRSSDDRTAPPR